MSSKKEKALVIIDVQVGLIEGLPAYNSEAVLANIADLLARAREAGVPVIYVQHDGEQGHLLETATPGWQIHPAIAPLQGEPVVRKVACDSFFETTLQRDLEAREVRHLVMAGAMTEYCVDTTCRRAASLGYDVTLAGDAHTTRDNDVLSAAQIISHHNALLHWFDAGDHMVVVKPGESIEFP